MIQLNSKFVTLILLLLSTFSIFSQEPDIISLSAEPKVLDSGILELKVMYKYPQEYHQSYLPDFFTVKSTSPGYDVVSVEYPEGKVDEYGIAQFYDSAELTVHIAKNAESAPQVMSLSAGYQLCDENGVCFLPGNREIQVEVPEAFSQAGITPGTMETSIPFGQLLQFLLFAFLGGLILNIMPCVLPVLSIKALHLVKQSEEDHESIKTHSLAYGAGVLAMFLGLALIIIAIQAFGNQVSWGFQFQNPYFVLGLASIMIFFSLGLFDVYIINIPGMSFAANAQNKKGYTGSFLSGLFAVILGAPCMGPFLGTALGFAFSQPPFIILLLFTFIALGLALPFVLLGFFPKLIKKLPKPGNWMNIFKEVLGFILLAFALFWLVFDVLYYQLSWKGMTNALVFIMAIAVFAWIFGRTQNSKVIMRRIIRTAALAGFIGISAFLLPSMSVNQDKTPVAEMENITSFSPAVIDELVQNKKPVFLEFSAKWCFTCKVNKDTVLNTDQVQNYFKDNNITHVFGDYTNADPVIGEWLRKFDRAGVPLYVAYVPGLPPLVLPEVITADDIYRVFAVLQAIPAADTTESTDFTAPTDASVPQPAEPTAPEPPTKTFPSM